MPASTVDEYLDALPAGKRAILEEVRQVIRALLPHATETISYQMPTFKLNNRPVVYFAAFKNHYSMFPATDGVIEALGDELKPHLAGRGTIRFRLDQPVPARLIEQIVAVRLTENASESSAGRA